MPFLRSALLLLLSALSTSLPAQQPSRAVFELLTDYHKAQASFGAQTVSLDFKNTLRLLFDRDFDQEELATYVSLLEQVEKLETRSLTAEWLTHELRLRLAALRLKERTAALPDEELENLSRIFDFENGPDWYLWMVKKWTGSDWTPEQLIAFGEAEVERVKEAIKDLNLPTTKPEHYFTKDRQKIIEKLRERAEAIRTNLFELFPNYEQLPRLNIAQGRNSALAQAPGYYNGNTFYFNLFDSPFDLADTDWLLIHEGNPGHHFQVNYHNQNRFNGPKFIGRSLGFVEGWAAYVENLGWEIGLYQDPYEALGKWNWDLIRSVRVVLDVRLNYEGWTDAQAMKYWRQHIKGKDDIGRREIARMKRWPAQVLTYKLGEKMIRDLLVKEKSAKGANFSYKDFHTTLLSGGPLPVQLIPQLFENESYK